MKIGIITFSSVLNYGAVLQAFALRRYITSIDLENEVYIIDYNPKYFQDKYKQPSLLSIIKHSKIKNYLAAWKCYNDLKKKNNAFSQFKSLYFNFGKVEQSYDYIVLGSDQIWNKKITGNCLDKYYWGNTYFESSTVISYAASFGDSLDIKDIPQVKYNLNHISYISVREKQSAETLNDIIHERDVRVVVDPVFLLSKEEWSAICKPINKRKFIFIYFFGNDEELFDKIEEYAKSNGFDVVYCTTGYCNQPRYDNTTSPIEFISYIKEASLVITNSFHATAFSLIFGTNFISIKRQDGNNLRISNLLLMSNSINLFVDSEVLTHKFIHKIIKEKNNSDENLMYAIEKSKEYLLEIFRKK